MLFHSNTVVLNKKKGSLSLSGIHKCGEEDNVNIGIQLAFGSPSLVFRHYPNFIFLQSVQDACITFFSMVPGQCT